MPGPGGKLGSPYCFATMQARAQVDRPVAVVDAVNTGSPTLWYVHVDHLNHPIKMTDGTKASVWNAVWTVRGAPHAITGSAALNARFPGLWFQVESGLHYNWHRHYDPTLGRYTQSDPLGFVDGPSVFAYAISSPELEVDPSGRGTVGATIGGTIGGAVGGAAGIESGPGAVATAIMGRAVGSAAGSLIEDYISHMAQARPPGCWAGDEGAEEWGKRNGIGAKAGKRRFHDIKQSVHGPGPADWSVHPETGDV